MKIKILQVLLILSLGTLYSQGNAQTKHSPTKTTSTIAAPVLKWANGGCYSSWCETGWYSSPAVADLDDIRAKMESKVNNGKVQKETSSN